MRQVIEHLGNVYAIMRDDFLGGIFISASKNGREPGGITHQDYGLSCDCGSLVPIDQKNRTFQILHVHTHCSEICLRRNLLHFRVERARITREISTNG